MSNKKTMIEEIEKSEASKKLDVHIEQFQKSLTKDHKKLIEETDKLVSSASDSEVKSLSTNLEIFYNFSVKLKKILPIQTMLTDTIREFKNIEWTNAQLIKFTNRVLCATLGKNYDTIQGEDEYYYNVLRRVSVCIVYELIHSVVKHIDNDAFSVQVGRKPKQICISMIAINKDEDLKKKYNKDGGKFAYITFEELQSIAKYFVLGVKDNNREYASKLVKMLRALEEYTADAQNFDTISTEIKKEEIDLVELMTCRFLSMLDADNQFITMSNIKVYLDNANLKNGLINFHKSYDTSKIKCVNFVNFKTQKNIIAETGDQLLKQLSNQ